MIKHIITGLVAIFIIAFAICAYPIVKLFFKYESIQQAIIKSHFEDDSYWEKEFAHISVQPTYKMVVIGNHGGEWSQINYLKAAAENLGWEAKIFFDTIGYEQEISAFNPDFIIYAKGWEFEKMGEEVPPISLLPAKRYAIFSWPITPSLAMLAHPHQLSKAEKMFFRIRKIIASPAQKCMDEWSKHYADQLKYILTFSDGVLSTGKEMSVIQNLYEPYAADDQAKLSMIRFFPSVQKTDFAPAQPKYLTFLGINWDDGRRSSPEYERFINRLAQETPLKIYGMLDRYLNNQDSYDGFIPSTDELLNIINQNGIYLLSHSMIHHEGGVPSARIFEAVAANSIVISDKHPFALEHFGDHFLYFDHDADPDTMVEQIKAHLDWIFANPEKAQAMAEQAHKIFLEKFALEHSLNSLAKMHEHILLDESKHNRTFPTKLRRKWY